jgi:hypothetical protein
MLDFLFALEESKRVWSSEVFENHGSSPIDHHPMLYR